MESTILEKPDPEPGNEPQEKEVQEPVVEAPEPKAEPEQPTETPTEVPEEPTIEFDGQRLTASQIKEWKEAHENKKEWQRANTQRAQEIAEERKKLARASLIEEQFSKRPELLQELFKPPVARNIDVELQSLYQSEPQDIFSPEHQQWMLNKDRLLLEKAETNAEQRAVQRITEKEAYEHNMKLGEEIEAKMLAKGRSAEDVLSLGQWVAENMKPKNGKFTAEMFEVAEAIKFGKESIRQAKLETAKQTVQSITKAKPASGAPGVQKPHESKDQVEREEDEWVNYMNEKHPPRSS